MAAADSASTRRYRRRILAWGAVATLLLIAGGARWYVGRVEDDLEHRVPAELAAAGFVGVAASFSGQEGTVRCVDPLSDPEAALDVAASVRGVRYVELDRSCRVNVAPTVGTSVPPTDGGTDDGTLEGSSASGSSGSVSSVAPAATGDPAFDSLHAVLVGDPQFSILASLVDEAGLSDELSSGGPTTLFAPTDDAFDALPADVLAELRRDPAQLARALRHHAVDGALGGDDLRTGTLPTLDGTSVEVEVAGSNVTVDGSHVIDPEIDAENGVVHPVDQVLVPSWLELDALDPTPLFGATLDRGRIELTGAVRTEQQRATLVDRTIAAFGAGLVDAPVTVDDSASVPDAAIDAVGAIVEVAPRRLAQAEVTFDGTDVVVAGTYVSDDARTAVETVATQVGARAELVARPLATAEQAAAVGTELATLVATTPIRFGPGGSALDDTSNVVLDRVAGVVAQFAGLTVLVLGYTDTSGSTVDNQLLSEFRAEAVRSALVERGLDPSAVASEGRGESMPVLVDGVEDAVASRRIELVVTTGQAP